MTYIYYGIQYYTDKEKYFICTFFMENWLKKLVGKDHIHTLIKDDCEIK